MFNWRKLILILGFFIAVIFIAWLLYFFFFKPAPIVPPLVEPPTEIPPGPFPRVDPRIERPPVEIKPSVLPIEVEKIEEVSEIALGGLTKTTPLTFEFTQVPTLGPDGQKLLYYNREEGKFYQLLPDGTKSLLSEKNFPEVTKITWAPNRKKAILEFPDDSKILYDFSQERQTTLPKNWYDFSFASHSQEMTFLTKSDDPNNRWLAIAKPDGSGAKIIEPLGENFDKVQTSWSPNYQIIALSRTGEALGGFRQEVLMIGQHGENFRSIIVEGRGFKAKWLPKGDRLLYHVWHPDNNYNPTLWIVDAQGENIGLNRENLGLNTWIDKCVFSKTDDYLYCAVPKELPEGAGLYPQLASKISDEFYKIDFNTGHQTLLAKPDDDFTIKDLVLSDDESYLYFTDQNKVGIYKIQLK